MCSAAKTSVEHVPPRCLFPKAKDVPPGTNTRFQMITVPACDTHNGAKSHDDEYLMYALVIGILNNATADLQVQTKIQRAIAKNPTLARVLTAHQVPVKLEEIQTGTWRDGVALRVDAARVRKSLEQVGRALYFHLFGEKWLDDIQVHPLFLIELEGEDAPAFNANLETLRESIEELMKSEPVEGSNPDVFTYQVKRVDWPEIPCVMQLTFFEGSKVVMLFRKPSAQSAAQVPAAGQAI